MDPPDTRVGHFRTWLERMEVNPTDEMIERYREIAGAQGQLFAANDKVVKGRMFYLPYGFVLSQLLPGFDFHRPLTRSELALWQKVQQMVQ